MNQNIDLHINSEVYVQLTELGRKHALKVYGRLPPENDGWSKWQLWILMNVFGELMQWGCDSPFERANIKIPIKVNVETIG
jgi:hypothetical protein